MRYAAKRDANEKALISLAKQLGAEWTYAPPLDGWCHWGGRHIPVEIKNKEGRNRYTESQELFIAMCQHGYFPVWTWRTEADVLKSLGAK